MKTPKVLLVLEEPQELKSYGIYLRDKGYETLRYTSAGEGLNSIERDPVSVVIVGQESPSFQGREVLEFSRRSHPEVPVLAVARVLDIHNYLEVMELGATDYLERPDPQDLAWVIGAQILKSQSS